MAAGERVFGLTSFGWRFAPAVAGTLAILVMCHGRFTWQEREGRPSG
jgi:hypothetical protein